MNNDLKRHLTKESIINFCINVPLNGWLAWTMVSEKQIIPAFGKGSYVLDLIVLGALLPMILGLIFLLMHQSKARKGKMAATAAPNSFWRALAGRPHWQTALAFGLFGASCALIVGVTASLISTTLTPVAYCVIKGLFGGLLSVAIVIPAIQLGLYQEKTNT